jgi:hypothetical protein
VTFGGARTLVDGYQADGELTRAQEIRMKALLFVAEHAPPRIAERALDRFVDEADGVSDPLVRAALLSVAEALRDQI